MDHLEDNQDLIPPWKAHPYIPRGSIGWRMGDGEVYLIKWRKWFTVQDSTKKKAYRKQYPEPIRWWGFYNDSALKIILVWLGHILLYPFVILDYKSKMRKLEESNKKKSEV